MPAREVGEGHFFYAARELGRARRARWAAPPPPAQHLLPRTVQRPRSPPPPLRTADRPCAREALASGPRHIACTPAPTRQPAPPLESSGHANLRRVPPAGAPPHAGWHCVGRRENAGETERGATHARGPLFAKERNHSTRTQHAQHYLRSVEDCQSYLRYQGELLGIWDPQNRDPRRKTPPETEFSVG